MDEHQIELQPLLWGIGWLAAVLLLFWIGLRLPLQTRLGRWQNWLYTGGVVVVGFALFALANVALTLHDGHVDLTREKIYTPSAAAMKVVDRLDREVRVTYFYHSLDPAGRRARDILALMQRRNPLFRLTAVDPDKEPTVARTNGIRIYNAAVIEADGRRVMVQSADEVEIALGVQRVLRERTITVCFIEGHNELPMDNFEFHTHLDGGIGHSHDDPSSRLVQMAAHGVGRFRRALEAQGYDARQLILATSRDVPGDCTLVVTANPRTTFLPGESAALRTYLAQGGAALFLFDLGYVLEPGLARLTDELGVRPEQQVVVDPLSHYMTDAEMVAVTGYDPHPITQSVSLTFYPGIRPLTLVKPAGDIRVTPLLMSSRESYTRDVAPVESRATDEPLELAATNAAAAPPVPGPRVLGVAADGLLPGGSRALRAVVIGDCDFASNSFFPYMSNSDLLLAAVRWLAHEERTTAVATRIPVPSLVLLTQGQARSVFILVVGLLPLTVITLGGLVWWRRR
jgi:gliding motility-associatede transport system auxiliary component